MHLGEPVGRQVNTQTSLRVQRVGFLQIIQYRVLNHEFYDANILNHIRKMQIKSFTSRARHERKASLIHQNLARHRKNTIQIFSKYYPSKFHTSGLYPVGIRPKTAHHPNHGHISAPLQTGIQPQKLSISEINIVADILENGIKN